MFIINIPFFNLDTIYKSGQVFRWYKLDDYKYIIPYRNKCVKVSQKKELITFSCTEEDFYTIWYKYFDLHREYNYLNYLYRKIDGNTRVACVRGKGLRIVKQDVFEVIVCSILCSLMGFEKTRLIVNKLCERCGTKHKNSFGDAGLVTWYEFPTVQQLSEYLSVSPFGYRYTKLIDICDNIIAGWLDINQMSFIKSTLEFTDYLSDFIDNDIISRIALCSGCIDSFLCDDVVNDVLNKEYNTNEQEFFEWYINGTQEYIDNAGYLSRLYYYNYKYPPIGFLDTEKQKPIYRKVKRRIK